MKTYKTLLFDIDDTLLNFQETEKVALDLLFKEFGFPLTPEVKTRYKSINEGLWRAFEEGKIDRDEVMNTRFSLLFKEYGKEVDGRLLEQSYRVNLMQGHHLIDGAIELIKRLKNDFDLYIVTNGDTLTQDRRLRDSGLYPLFKDIFISEETGFQKPMVQFFDYVFTRIPNIDLNQTLIIGDSLSSDIKGGNNTGIDSCWYNPMKKEIHSDIIPTYEIHKLEDLYQILNVLEPSK